VFLLTFRWRTRRGVCVRVRRAVSRLAYGASRSRSPVALVPGVRGPRKPAERGKIASGLALIHVVGFLLSDFPVGVDESKFHKSRFDGSLLTLQLGSKFFDGGTLRKRPSKIAIFVLGPR